MSGMVAALHREIRDRRKQQESVAGTTTDRREEPTPDCGAHLRPRSHRRGPWVRFPAAPRTGVADALTRNSDCCADRGRTGCWAVASWADPPGPRGRAGRWAALPRRGLRRAGWPCRGWGRRVVMPRSRVRLEQGAGQKLSDPKRRHTTVARTGQGTGDDGPVSPDVAHFLF